jgi:hypothetical protein
MRRIFHPARGLAPLLACLVLLAGVLALIGGALAAFGSAAERERATERSLAEAREALIAYAVDRAITSWVGPGYLPCPDLDDDGWAESTCGSQSGDSGQEQRLGRLPWKTLGLPDLRDGHGERLWYAVSSKYKGLLNCAVSHACLDMSPDAALGTITVRDAAGTLTHDGRSTDLAHLERSGAVAVILAPGPALARTLADGSSVEQQRTCSAGECDATGRCLAEPPRLVAKCHPANYLDRAAAARFANEDNADFVDRNDAGRSANGNGFIAGPVRDEQGNLVVNDRLAVVSYADIMPRLMKRVALEVAHCLRYYATRPENGGRYPWPTPACLQAASDPSIAWNDSSNVIFGRVPDTPFTRTRDASGARMLDRWWRYQPRTPEDLGELPVKSQACRIAFEPDDDGVTRRLAPGSPSSEGRTAGLAENAWWTSWKPFVFYALARDLRPDAPAASACLGPDDCLDVATSEDRVVASGRHFAVIVAGAPLAALVQGHGRGALGDARQWVEGAHAELEGRNPNPAAPACPADLARPACTASPACNRVVAAAATPLFNDVAVAYP